MTFTIHIASWVWPFLGGFIIGLLIGGWWGLIAGVPRFNL